MASRLLLLVLMIGVSGLPARADEKRVRLYAPPALVETGVFKFILPRFSLKTQVKVELVDEPAQAEVVLGDEGRALFEGAGHVWHVRSAGQNDTSAIKLESWLLSDIGRRTVLSFAPNGAPVFAAPSDEAPKVAVLSFDGDARQGHDVSRLKCGRCHAVDEETRMSGIGSTPSFSALRSLSDWQERFTAFYALNPHPAFTVVEDVTAAFAPERPPPIAPVHITLAEIENVLAYVAALEAADLGAPLEHQ